MIKAHDLRRNSLREPRQTESTLDSERRTPTRHINHLITNKRKDSIMINLNAKQFPDQ